MPICRSAGCGWITVMEVLMPRTSEKRSMRMIAMVSMLRGAPYLHSRP